MSITSRNNYIKREIEGYCRGAFGRFPAVAVLGPRQSGKTTLAKKLFPDLPYFNLETPTTRAWATDDPVNFLKSLGAGAVLDEIQNVPELFSYLQVHIDHADCNGQFVLTGSHQFKLVENITQSMAGRVAITKLLPLSLAELSAQLSPQSVEELVWRGGYPRAWGAAEPPEVYLSYAETYIERDVRLLLNIKDAAQFRRFLQLVAGRTGQLLNRESLARDAGLNVKTVEAWLSVLEASFIIFRLQPYHANLGKRLIKSPKLYFVDTGLACHLLRIDKPEQLLGHPLCGELFETMIISEILKRRYNHGRSNNLYFYRDVQGVEVDLLLEQAGGVFPIEIKLSSTFHPQFCNGLNALASLSPKGAAVIMGGGVAMQRGNASVVPWTNLEPILPYIDM